jgi:hypothetical protein
MSSQRIRDIFEVATWVYGMKHYALMDEVILEAHPVHVLSTIEGLEIPKPLMLPLLLAWGEHYAARDTPAARQIDGLVREVAATSVYASMHAITQAYRARIGALSFVRVPPIMKRTWVYEATLPYTCAPSVPTCSMPESVVVPVTQYSHTIDRAQLLDRLIRVETELAMRMPAPPTLVVASATMIHGWL